MPADEQSVLARCEVIAQALNNASLAGCVGMRLAVSETDDGQIKTRVLAKGERHVAGEVTFMVQQRYVTCRLVLWAHMGPGGSVRWDMVGEGHAPTRGWTHKKWPGPDQGGGRAGAGG